MPLRDHARRDGATDGATRTPPTILIVPGLRDEVAQHWQTLLAAQLRAERHPVHALPAPGRADLRCSERVAAIEDAVASIEGPVLAVAHSAGCVMMLHWARHTRRSIAGALLAAPPDFEQPMPAGYPTLDELRQGGWLPQPLDPLPFPSLVAASRNDPLASFERVAQMARAWGSAQVDLGEVGHLNPASGFGPWPRAIELIEAVAALPAHR